MAFRDRFFTPKVARAILSPSGMLLAGGAAAVTILAGGGLLAIPAAVVAWAVRVGAAIPRGGSGPRDRVDPYMLGEPWKQYVLGAQTAKLRFDRTVKGTAAGPIRDRLAGPSDRLDAGIQDCWRVACHGNEIDHALGNLSTAEATRQLNGLQAQLRGRQPTASQASTLQSLQAQLDSANRMQAVSQDANDRLRLLDARLDELVAKAVEVSVGAGDSGWLSQEVDTVVTDLEALRQALEDTNSAAAGDPLPPLPSARPATDPPSGQTSPPSA